MSGVEIPVELTGRRAGDPVALFADTAKAAEALGWRARYGLEDIVASAWAWHSSHPHGYAPAVHGAALQFPGTGAQLLRQTKVQAAIRRG